jgi:molecular chaperone DnaK
MNFRSLYPGKASTPVDTPLRVIGIDLGTTNSTVAEILVESGDSDPSIRCLNIDQATTQGRYTHVLVPSVVAVRSGETWVGEGAKRLRTLPGAGVEESATWFAETKNDMGIRRTYHRAPAGFGSARAIAAEILKFLYQATIDESELPISRLVVTVPASFQAAQRQDTIAAAQRAGLALGEGELFDEPVAAFLAYLAEVVGDDSDILPAAGETKNLAVFDFGGGTCDVAVFRIGRQDGTGLTITPLNVSRYHRLGGGDIDRAIIHEVLLPQLMEQNGLDPFSLDFEQKRHFVQPALLGVAEALKQKLCIEVVRLRKLGLWDKTDKGNLAQILPGSYPVKLKDRTLSLQNPKLTAQQFEDVMVPFLERDLLLPKEDEYRVSCSIFAPLQDAITRSGLERDQIHLCLLAGGSTLIPQVADAVASYFSGGRLLTFPDREATQTAIAKGAAIHALSLALTGKGVFQPVCHDDICFQTNAGPVELVPRGAELPYPPSGGFARREDFKAPAAVKAGCQGQIRVAIVAGDERRLLFDSVWKIAGPVRKGEHLWLEHRFDENQALQLRMGKKHGATELEVEIQNPLTHVVNPNETRARVEDIEEAIRNKKVTREELPAKFEELGDLHRKLRLYEKGLSYYGRAVQLWHEPPAYLFNRMAFCARDLGDRERTDRIFAEADRLDPWSGTFFNWALAKEQWGKVAEALELCDKALAMQADPAYSALKARLVQRLGDSSGGLAIACEALRRFAPVPSQSEFELYWFGIAARISGEEQLWKEADREARSRAARPNARPAAAGDFPDREQTAGEED